MTGFNEIMELAKRRGFFWQSFSLYGGLNGFYDYAPLGSLLRDNIISIWKRSYMEAGAVFIDTPVVTPESVYTGSGKHSGREIHEISKSTVPDNSRFKRIQYAFLNLR